MEQHITGMSRLASAGVAARSWILRPETLWLLLVMAFLCRAALVVANYLDLTVNEQTDTGEYVPIARQLINEGQGYFRVRTPGYPLFLALTGLDLKLALLLQGMLGFATCLLVYFGVRSRYGEVAGRLALGFLALDLTTITYGNLLLTETLFAALLTLGLVLAPTSESKGQALGCGAALAAATYVRPVGMLLGCLWPLVIALVWKKPRRAALVLAATWLLLLPWFFWQKEHYGAFRFSAITRINLLQYNAAYVIADIEGRSINEVQEEFNEIPRLEWEARAIDILMAHPLTYLKLVAQEAPVTLLSPAWGAFRYMLQGGREWQYTVAAGAACLFWLWLPFSALAARKQFGLFALVTAAYLILIPGPQGRARFRVPAVPALAIAAGIGLARKLEQYPSEQAPAQAADGLNGSK